LIIRFCTVAGYKTDQKMAVLKYRILAANRDVAQQRNLGVVTSSIGMRSW